jgi:hypothetical protein
LPKSTVRVGATIGSTSPGHNSLTLVYWPCGVSWSRLTVTWICVVVTGSANGTGTCTAALPVTVPASCQAEPSQVSTVKSTGTPSEFDSSVTPGSVTGVGEVIVSTAG